MNAPEVTNYSANSALANERGGAVVGLTLLMLLLGITMLHATHKQLRDSLSLVVEERAYLIDFHRALSAQAWGTRLNWPQREGWHCQQEKHFLWQACALWLDKSHVLLRGTSLGGDKNALALWRWMQPYEQGKMRVQASGWIDFCPLKDIQRCLP